MKYFRLADKAYRKNIDLRLYEDDIAAAIAKVMIIPHDSFHESQIRIPAIRGNRTTYTHISSTFQVATLLL